VHLVTAILPPHRLGDVHAALADFGVHGMTISQVTGFGTELWSTQMYRGRAFYDESVSNVRIEVLVATDDVSDVVEIVRSSATSRSSGAGKIWVVPVDFTVRIRTGERGLDAL
jgi:nitrogen regulatory protein P-II 1